MNPVRKMSAKADPNLRSTPVVAYEGPLDLRDRDKSHELDLNCALSVYPNKMPGAIQINKRRYSFTGNCKTAPPYTCIICSTCYANTITFLSGTLLQQLPGTGTPPGQNRFGT